MTDDPTQPFESDFTESNFDNEYSDGENDGLIPGTRVYIDHELGEIRGYTRTRTDEEGGVEFEPEGLLTTALAVEEYRGQRLSYVGMPVEIDLTETASVTGRIASNNRRGVEVQFDSTVTVEAAELSKV